MAPLVADQTYLADPAKGVSEADLAPLRPDDPRDTQRLGVFAARCDGLSAAVVAQHTVGGLDGCRIVVEGFGPSGPALAEAVVERGGSVVAVSTSAGAAASTNGLDVSAITEAWSEHREALVEHIGEPIDEPVLSIGSEVIFAGSGMGVIGHQAAADLGHARAVVPCGRLPLTARGLAVLRSMGVPAPADFLALAGSTLALWGDPNRTDAEILAGITEDVADLSAEFARHPDGPLLAACYEAESFLGTWRDTLPFGRPLAP